VLAVIYLVSFWVLYEVAVVVVVVVADNSFGMNVCRPLLIGSINQSSKRMTSCDRSSYSTRSGSK